MSLKDELFGELDQIIKTYTVKMSVKSLTLDWASVQTLIINLVQLLVAVIEKTATAATTADKKAAIMAALGTFIDTVVIPYEKLELPTWLVSMTAAAQRATLLTLAESAVNAILPVLGWTSKARITGIGGDIYGAALPEFLQ